MKWLLILFFLLYISVALIIGIFTIFDEDENPRIIDYIIWPFSPLILMTFIAGYLLLGILLNPLIWIIGFLIAWIFCK